MGKEKDHPGLGLKSSGNSEVDVARKQIAPDRVEHELLFQGRRYLYLGIQPDLYSAYWANLISGAEFANVLSQLKVPPTSTVMFHAPDHSEREDLVFEELPAVLSRCRSPLFMRIDTKHLDFVWEGGDNIPSQLLMVGVIGDQVDMQVLGEFYLKTAKTGLLDPVSRSIRHILKDFPDFKADFK